MKTEHIVKALEGAARQFGLVVRWEKGPFRGGRCTVNGEELIMLNKRQPPEINLIILSESLRDFPVDTIFLRPAVREALEDAWQRETGAAWQEIPAIREEADAE
ncbi:MAG: hypothetical protein ACE5G0_18920 [Rhodothermales bacterium]